MSSDDQASLNNLEFLSSDLPEVEERFACLRRRIRLLVLLQSAESAGITPIGILQLHTLAYLSNVLAPVWELEPLDGKVMKRQGGPFYPSLQHDLDELVASGLVSISNLGYLRDDDDRWRLNGSFGLNHVYADPPIRHLMRLGADNDLIAFMNELAYAFAALSEQDLSVIVSQDATYSDQLTTVGNIVDFGEWQNLNYSANAANYFRHFFSEGIVPTRGEKLHLYARHLHRRLHATPRP